MLTLTFASEDEKAKFEYLYEKYKRLLYAKAKDIVKDHALAEDAVSEGFLRAYKNFSKIGDPNSPQTISYLVTIVRNVAINIYHKEKNTQPTDFTDYDAPDDFNLEEIITQKDDTHQALKLVHSLKEELRSVFLLKYAYDMNHREIAKTLGISENNVTVRLHRAKAKLLKLANKEKEAQS